MHIKNIFTWSLMGAVILSMPLFAGEQVKLKSIDSLIDKYIEKYKNEELVTGVGATFLSGSEIISTAHGFESNKRKKRLTNNTYFQIGSITKSFTAALILKLEAEGKLNINQTIGDWLPEYDDWKGITIKQLLNMTSTIPGYATIPTLADSITDNPKKQWTSKELVDLAYGYKHPTSGYNYSDTNYLILGMIIEKVTHDSFHNQLQEKILKPLQLKETYYITDSYTPYFLKKMPESYYYGRTVENLKHGQKSTNDNLSMAGPAGAIVATTSDVAKWIKALFSSDFLLPKQQMELKSLISMKTGTPISHVDSEEPNGFGLGVVQGYKPQLGKYWYYEGDTVGFRVLYIYHPCNEKIVVIALNSSPFVDEAAGDHSGDLLLELYKNAFGISQKCE
ncbi:TPA: serine hydrolase [Legionella pneumophila subsp. pneumophila]|nr:serine hydrolase [Legionella pneumophila subsp. pneumophila]